MTHRRRRVGSRTLALEALEPRQLLSRLGKAALPFAAAGAAPGPAVLAEDGTRHDLDAWALQLVMHPRHAERQGLGRLAAMLARHPAMARDHG